MTHEEEQRLVDEQEKILNELIPNGDRVMIGLIAKAMVSMYMNGICGKVFNDDRTD